MKPTALGVCLLICPHGDEWQVASFSLAGRWRASVFGPKTRREAERLCSGMRQEHRRLAAARAGRERRPRP